MPYKYKRRTFDEAQELAKREFRSRCQEHFSEEELRALRERGASLGGTVGEGWEPIVGFKPETNGYYEFQLYLPSDQCP